MQPNIEHYVDYLHRADSPTRQSTILEIRIGPCGHTFNDARSYITVGSEIEADVGGDAR